MIKHLFSVDEMKVSGLLISFFGVLFYVLIRSIVSNVDIQPNYLNLLLTMVAGIAGINGASLFAKNKNSCGCEEKYIYSQSDEEFNSKL